VIPLGLDLYMPVPDENPITAEKVDLGRRLFHDRRLSRDGRVACASCHDPRRAFSTPQPQAIGVFNRKGRRNAPALINRAWGRAFFRDGRITTLEEQVMKPIQDPNEMDLTLAEASARVGLDVDTISRALATYVRSALSGNTPYDRLINGDRRALSREQQRGLQIFRGKGNCTACHVGPTFSDERLHNTGIAWQAQTGVFTDPGRFEVTKKIEDRGAFKTPTLREVARTSPNMHDGSLPTLEAVVNFYSDGAREIPISIPRSALSVSPARRSGRSWHSSSRCREPFATETDPHRILTEPALQCDTARRQSPCDLGPGSQRLERGEQGLLSGGQDDVGHGSGLDATARKGSIRDNGASDTRRRDRRRDLPPRWNAPHARAPRFVEPRRARYPADAEVHRVRCS
jgi:cytochrome c peroxidase